MRETIVGFALLVGGMLILERALFFHAARLLFVGGSSLQSSELEKLFPRQFRANRRQAIFAIYSAASLTFLVAEQLPISLRGLILGVAAFALLSWDFAVFFKARENLQR